MATAALHHVGLDQVRKSWSTFLLLGVLLVVLGMVAISQSFLMTTFSVIFFGWLLIFAGISEVVHAFWRERAWGGFFLDLLSGILYTVVGFLFIVNPESTAITLTLLIAFFLIFEGAFRIAAAVVHRFPHWGWVLFNGAVTLLLGVLIWRQWPIAGLWVIGLFVGINILLNGWSLIMLGLAAKNLPASSS